MYLHSFESIVHKDIQTSILFFADFIEQLLDFFIVSMVTLHWYTLSATLLSYLKSQIKKNNNNNILKSLFH